jgi:hypothetical protein
MKKTKKTWTALMVTVLLVMLVLPVGAQGVITGTFNTDWAWPAIGEGLNFASLFGPIVGIGLVLFIGFLVLDRVPSFFKGFLSGRR